MFIRCGSRQIHSSCRRLLGESGSQFNFSYNTDSEAFGQLVKNYHQPLNDDSKVKVITREEIYARNTESNGLPEPKERLQPETLEGMMNKLQIKIPERLTKTIYNHMLALHEPKALKFSVAELYLNLNKELLYKQTKKNHEVDPYIAAFFAQDYASTYQVLTELFKRVPDFKPEKVLDIGYGPATGMLALNEIMGDNFNPKFKDSIIVGSEEMKSRAKLLLSRQVCEYPGDINDLVIDLNESEEKDFIGEVKTKKIKIRTQLSNDLNKSKRFNLIIAQHQLLTDVNAFPYQVDDKVDSLLKLLEPNGILVLIERGSPLGFENIARARQIMIRPENFLNEKGKIPRPYLKGSSTKQELEIEEIEEDFFIDEDGNEVTASELEKELNLKFGEVTSNDLEFKDLEEGKNDRIDYHLSIIAPCSHHKKCPLQTLKPHYYSFPTGKKLTWCKFEKMLERPRYLLELKRGKTLSSKWDSDDSISSSNNSKSLSGREFANNYEIANYSYLITQRSKNDVETLDKISSERTENKFDDSIGKFNKDSKYWPRILRQPLKRKGHVTMELCAPSGEIEKWTVTKSFNKEVYYDSRKSTSGDLWGLDAKTKLIGRSNQNDVINEKLKNYELELINKENKIKKLNDKLNKRQSLIKSNEILKNNESIKTDEIIELYTNKFNSSKKQKQKDKKGGLNTFIE